MDNKYDDIHPFLARQKAKWKAVVNNSVGIVASYMFNQDNYIAVCYIYDSSKDIIPEKGYWYNINIQPNNTSKPLSTRNTIVIQVGSYPLTPYFNTIELALAACEDELNELLAWVPKLS